MGHGRCAVRRQPGRLHRREPGPPARGFGARHPRGGAGAGQQRARPGRPGALGGPFRNSRAGTGTAAAGDSRNRNGRHASQRRPHGARGRRAARDRRTTPARGRVTGFGRAVRRPDRTRSHFAAGGDRSERARPRNHRAACRQPPGIQRERGKSTLAQLADVAGWQRRRADPGAAAVRPPVEGALRRCRPVGLRPARRGERRHDRRRQNGPGRELDGRRYGRRQLRRQRRHRPRAGIRLHGVGRDGQRRAHRGPVRLHRDPRERDTAERRDRRIRPLDDRRCHTAGAAGRRRHDAGPPRHPARGRRERRARGRIHAQPGPGLPGPRTGLPGRAHRDPGVERGTDASRPGHVAGNRGRRRDVAPAC